MFFSCLPLVTKPWVEITLSLSTLNKFLVLNFSFLLPLRPKIWSNHLGVMDRKNSCHGWSLIYRIAYHKSLRLPASYPSNDDPLTEAAPLVALQTDCKGLLP
jgi:hypothetical protein